MCFSNHPEKGQICMQFPTCLDCKILFNLYPLACIQQLQPSVLYWCHPPDIQCFGSTETALVWGYQLTWFWVHIIILRYRNSVYSSTNKSFTAMRQILPCVLMQSHIFITINNPWICFISILGNRFVVIFSIGILDLVHACKIDWRR